MKHTYTQILFLFFCLSLMVQGQTPVKKSINDPKALDVLNKASESYMKAGGVKSSFTLKVLSQGGAQRENITGNILLKGQRFKIETSEMIVWFDGINQWVYLKSNNEINLSKPSPKDLLTLNPINIFQLYKYGYNSKLLSDKVVNGKKLFQVELKPTSNENTQSIVATFDKTNYRPVGIIVSNKDKSGSQISIGSYLTGQTYSNTLFTFAPKDYPNAEVIDLR